MAYSKSRSEMSSILRRHTNHQIQRESLPVWLKGNRLEMALMRDTRAAISAPCRNVGAFAGRDPEFQIGISQTVLSLLTMRLFLQGALYRRLRHRRRPPLHQYGTTVFSSSSLTSFVDFDSQTSGIKDEVTFHWSDHWRSHIGGRGVPCTRRNTDGWSTRHPRKSPAYSAGRYSSRCNSRDAWCQRYPRAGGRGQGGLRSCLLTLWCLIRYAGEDWASLCQARKSQNARFSAYPNN
jgi:hypothetical protein